MISHITVIYIYILITITLYFFCSVIRGAIYSGLVPRPCKRTVWLRLTAKDRNFKSNLPPVEIGIVLWYSISFLWVAIYFIEHTWLNRQYDIYIYIHIQYIYMYVYMHMYVFMYMYMYIYIYNICIHLCIHINCTFFWISTFLSPWLRPRRGSSNTERQVPHTRRLLLTSRGVRQFEQLGASENGFENGLHSQKMAI